MMTIVKTDYCYSNNSSTDKDYFRYGQSFDNTLRFCSSPTLL